MIDRTINWFVPPVHRDDPEIHRQARLIVSTCFVTGTFSTTYLIQAIDIGFEQAMWAMVFNAVSFLLLPFLFRAVASMGLIANVYVLVGTIGVGVCAYYSGGLSSYVLPWFAVLPMAGVLLSGLRVGAFWTAVSVACVGSFGVLAMNGHPFPVEYPLESESILYTSSMAGLVLILFAITFIFYSERRRAFLNLHEKNDELTSILERLRRTQAQLVHQEKMASLGQLTTGLAHEFRNPLNFISNFAQNLPELADDLRVMYGRPDADLAEVEGLLSDISESGMRIVEHGRRADEIVHRMLEHSRATSAEKRSLDLDALVDDCIRLFNHDLPHSIIFDRQLNGSAGPVEVAPQELSRVLHALLSNSVDAVSERLDTVADRYEPVIRITTGRTEAFAEVRIEDNGPGVPDELVDRIFQPFFTTKPPGKGTGLGLSVAYGIISEAHGGELLVERGALGGAAFIIRLPVHAAIPATGSSPIPTLA
jgi:two-component system, NtrC family, sensor kinase